MPVKQVVAQHQGTRAVTDKIAADDESLRQSIRTRLHSVSDGHAPLRAVAKSLSAADPADQQEFDRRQTQFATAMTDLSKQFSDALRSCTVKDMVVSHEAFTYLAKAVGLTQVGISGLSPDAEPSPARLAQVAELVKAQGVTTIYYETLVDPKVAKTLADETGATAAVLDPLEGLVPGTTGDYVSIMQSNLKTLQQGQVCP